MQHPLPPMALMLRMVAEQREGSNMTTYVPDAPNKLELAPIAYPIDADGHPIAPERLGVHAQTHDFSLPACFHRLSVDVSLQTGENTSNIALTCPVQPAEEKCPFSINLSSLIAGDGGMNYERYAAKIPDATKDKDLLLREYLSRSLSPLNALEDDAASLDAQFEDPSYTSLDGRSQSPSGYATDDELSLYDEPQLPEHGRRPNIELPQVEDTEPSQVPESLFPPRHLGRYSALWYRVPAGYRSISAPLLPFQTRSRSSTPDSMPDLTSAYSAPGDYQPVAPPASPVPESRVSTPDSLPDLISMYSPSSSELSLPDVAYFTDHSSPVHESRVSTPDSLPDLISVYSPSSSELSLPDLAYSTDHSSPEDVSGAFQRRGVGHVRLGDGKAALDRLADDMSEKLEQWTTSHPELSDATGDLKDYLRRLYSGVTGGMHARSAVSEDSCEPPCAICLRARGSSDTGFPDYVFAEEVD